MSTSHDEPCYTIGVVSRMVDLHPQTLRNYEQMGLVVPHRTEGNIRLYSPAEVERLRKINRLTQELGVNLAGVAVILHMTDQIEALQTEIAALQAQIARLSVTHAEDAPAG